jgi:uncharacterized protein (DUF305 family)
MLMRRTIASFLLLVVPAAFTLAACNETNSSQPTENSGSSNAAPIGSSTGSHNQSSPMPMDHSALMSMDLGPADESFDLRFIDSMTPHHEGAVAMAQEALQKSNRPEIKKLSQAITEAQEQEISALQQWRTAWYPRVGDEPMMYHAEMGHMMPMTKAMRSSMMMSGDLGPANEQFDLRFIEMMIPHHQGAIEMAQQALEKSKRPEIKKLAQDIIASQQQEIDQMKQWRKDWYGQ